MKKIINISIIFLTILCAQAHADWTYSYNDFLKAYQVSDGKSSLRFKTEKSAKKAAKALNKAEKKGQIVKEGDSVWDDGSGNCDRPGINC